jgi:hypothetical protein
LTIGPPPGFLACRRSANGRSATPQAVPGNQDCLSFGSGHAAISAVPFQITRHSSRIPTDEKNFSGLMKLKLEIVPIFHYWEKNRHGGESQDFFNAR